MEAQDSVKQRIIEKLQSALSPASLTVEDESHLHQGHGGWREGGETHFRVMVVSSVFEGKSRVERHRLVNDVLKDELKDRVHALALSTKASSEDLRHDDK